MNTLSMLCIAVMLVRYNKVHEVLDLSTILAYYTIIVQYAKIVLNMEIYVALLHFHVVLYAFPVSYTSP